LPPRPVLLDLDPSLLSSLRELGELKRIRSASRTGSVAERLFLSGWSSLASGVPTLAAMQDGVAAALSAIRLGDLDLPTLVELGVPADEAIAILRRAAASMPGLPALDLPAGPPSEATAPVPGFASLLARQPRAGITCPDRPRVLLEPPENHAEHCLAVAVYGVALSPTFGADPQTVWLAGMAHHLHNAFLPDSGFTGEMLLGEHLEPIMQRATERALAELSGPLAARVRAARRILADADTPEGRAFHAADTLDRVWQIDQHLRAGRLDLRFVLDDMALVHEGPVKRFQDEVLRAAGLAA
jgi:5'-deoxynucleotidase YfbR-like HD superfamily hydrolase